MVRALTSHQCGPDSIPGLGVICGNEFVFGSSPRFSGFPMVPHPWRPRGRKSGGKDFRGAQVLTINLHPTKIRSTLLTVPGPDL